MYNEFDHKLGLIDSIKELLVVEDSVSHRDHPHSDIVIQKLYQHLAGYHAYNFADDLSTEPLLTSMLGKERLASQPTISRFNEKVGFKTVKPLAHVNEVLQRQAYAIKPQNLFIFDVDSSGFAAYGNQFGANFNFNYQQFEFHSLFFFDGFIGDCPKTELRAGNVYTSRQVFRFIAPLLTRYETWVLDALIIIRGDSGFAAPGLFKLAESKGQKYAIRLKSNARLQSIAQNMADKLISSDNLHKRQVYHKEFMYQASSWKRARHVAVKMESPAGELMFQFTFIVTNMTLQPRNVVRFYCQRGNMENFIKEAKMDLPATK